MKRAFLCLLLVGVLATGGLLVGCAPQQTPPQEETTPQQPPAESPDTGEAPAGGTNVTIANFAFSPAEVQVKVGDTVTWTNEDSAPHTVKGDGFESEQFNQGETYSYSFDTAGTYEYICSIHPQMTGRVVVTE